MRQRTILLGVLVGVLGTAALEAPYLLGAYRVQAVARVEAIPAQIEIPLPADRNFRQGPNECGPYAIAAFLTAMGTPVEPKTLVEELPWKLPHGYTHPHALEELLRQHDFVPTGWNVAGLRDADKDGFLLQHLAEGRPVILLVQMYGFQHYVVLLGYDGGNFLVYDPVFTRGEEGMTKDANGPLPGNRFIPADELLAAWSEGGIGGFYEWYALTGVKKK
jgi:hypothetical protein